MLTLTQQDPVLPSTEIIPRSISRLMAAKLSLIFKLNNCILEILLIWQVSQSNHFHYNKH